MSFSLCRINDWTKTRTSTEETGFIVLGKEALLHCRNTPNESERRFTIYLRHNVLTKCARNQGPRREGQSVVSGCRVYCGTNSSLAWNSTNRPSLLQSYESLGQIASGAAKDLKKTFLLKRFSKCERFLEILLGIVSASAEVWTLTYWHILPCYSDKYSR